MQPELRALSVNGAVEHSAARTLLELLESRGLDLSRGGFACAVNGAFVPRQGWAAQVLGAGDRVDIVTPVVGG